MKTRPLILLAILNLIFFVISPTIFAQTCIQNFAPQPPLGFNSFDSYRSSLTEDKAFALIDVMAENISPMDMSTL